MKDKRLPHKMMLLLFCALLLACSPSQLAPSAQPSQPAPSPSPQPTGTPSTFQTLTVWHSWDAEEEGLIRSLLADYQNQHPGIRVRLRRVPVGQILSEYEDAVLAGEGPDILVGHSHWIGRLADGNMITPLEEIVDGAYWDGFYPFALTGVEYQGHRYAVPYSSETVVLYYNRDFIGEPPTTTTELLELAANWAGEEQAGLAFPLSFYNTVGYLYAFGGRLFDEEGHAALDTNETRAWLAWLQDVRAAPGVIFADSYGQADAMFKGANLAMVVNGSWALSDYVRTLGVERLGVAPLPLLSQTQSWPTPLVGYRVLMLNPVRLAFYPEDSLELLCFLGGPLPQRLLAIHQNMVPTSAELDLSGSPLLQGLVRQAELGRPRPVSTRIELLWDPLDELLYKVTSGRVPAEQALPETQRQIEQSLEDTEDLSP